METLQRTANRGSVSTGYDIDNSICFEDANDENLVKNYSGDGDRRTWTYSTWVKKVKFGSSSFDYAYMFAAQYTSIHFLNNGILRVALYDDASTVYADPSQVFRDGSAWYNIIVTLDTTQGTAADRVKIWINGVRVTSFSNSTYTGMSQNKEFTMGKASANYQVGYFFAGGGSNYGFNGYMAETHYVNGTALDETSFGEYDSDSGIWIPKKYTGSHGTKGFYLKFDDSSNLGKDSASSGIGDFSLTNITAIDQATDTPTNNFATLNPLIYDINSGDDESYVMTNGATTIAASKNAYAQNYATIGLNIASGGKWYFEWTATSTANGSSSEGLCGIAFDTQWDAGSNSTAVYNAGYAYYAAGFGSGDGYAANVVNGFLIDLDNNKIKWYKNGTLHITMPDDGGGSTMQTSGYAFPYIAPYGSGYTINVNLGGFTAQTISSANTDPNGYGSFEYPTQDGYAICTKNLAEYG
jgi:hypothetical protein